MMTLRLVMVPLLLLTVASLAAPIPIILDTDIGQDFDDSWALSMALSQPDKWDIKLVLTAQHNTVGRAQVVAKYLTEYGRTDIPIGIGVWTDNYVGPLYPWAQDFNLSRYAGKVYSDGVGAALSLLQSAPAGQLSYVAIAPTTNFAELLRRAPTIYTKVHSVFAMFGSIDYCYGMHPGGCPEYNVATNITASRQFIAARWPLLITPLDTCDYPVNGSQWQELLAANTSAHPKLQTFLGSYCAWSNGNCHGVVSDVVYDAVAMYMAYSLGPLQMTPLTISVNNAGTTVRDPNGSPVQAALHWQVGGLERFFSDVVNFLINWK